MVQDGGNGYLRTETSEVDGVVVLRLAGELDMVSERVPEDEVRARIADRPPAVVLDLREVTFFGSNGISLVLGALQEARRHAVGFALVADSRPVLRPLEVTDVLAVVRVFGTVDDAVASLLDVPVRSA
ncbi:STAS domain-containing protein [Saccharothrix variisporea]|uniref:Anti-sigma factor antagonist n=1 Tax=Saccharothrix variisporea TaxID=543527 RepID=A0A495X0H2_9PSEU|nr:STAS domain-containing protein [Saccharothrix variisporea]RKT67159.1 anti-anti-sigma factor [Saccharothrix variisporea]